MLKTPSGYLILISLFIFACRDQGKLVLTIESSDVERYWKAYDQIVGTTDSTERFQILDEVFLQPASPGQLAMMERRNYTAEEYLENIEQLPEFWASVRENTLRASEFAGEIESGIEQLREIYPDLKPAEIYFTMGCLRSNGTTLDSLVLIGAELAMTDPSTDLSELPERVRQNLQPFVNGNPIEELAFLNVHEYVHTQQSTHGIDLLSQCVYEGVAEFVSTVAMNTASSTPAIAFGPENDDRIQAAFVKQMNSTYFMDWMYNSFDNEFAMRDLGYYVGFAIAQRIYEQAIDKKAAIAEMIRLDYGDQTVIDDFVERSGYFDQPISTLREAADSEIPQVLSIGEMANDSRAVDPSIKELKIEFSKPMDIQSRGFDFGPEGEAAALFIQTLEGWDETGTVLTVGISLEPGRLYQLVLSNDFRSADGVRLEPYLIEFQTTD
ncbi:MAG: hypothetical protein AAGF87_02005 [Bacteroidota bacterium]